MAVMTVTDPTFYRSAAEAAAAPREQLAYVVAFDRAGEKPDALTVIDVDEASATYGQVVGWADLPTLGDELHHFGWNACSSALKHEGHDMDDGLQRRYLLLPGLRSSQRPRLRHPARPALAALHKTIDAQGARREGRLLAPAHAALRAGRRLPDLPRRRATATRAGRHRAARPHHLRRAARLGDRPRAAVPGLRRLVAPQPEHR